MNAAFRSHIMQQFAATARTQARPPLALVQQLSQSEDNTRGDVDYDESSLLSSNNNSLMSPQIPLFRTSRQLSTARPHVESVSLRDKSHSIRRPRHMSSALPQSSSDMAYSTEDDEKDNNSNKLDGISEAAASLQSLIKTRRTISVFDTSTSSLHGGAAAVSSDQRFFRDALERAVTCAMEAPNHKRTEPVSFRRMVSPSSATNALADISYQVALRRGRSKGKAYYQQAAERKRDKWKSIPAFLVALVRGQPCQQPKQQQRQQQQQQDTIENDDRDTRAPDSTNFVVDDFEELPFVPPLTETQLEDYASACAAVQNALLSLHSEGIGSKWATGPVIRTSAFRSLVEANEDELVVGLVMVGLPKQRQQQQGHQQQRRQSNKISSRSPLRKRQLSGDILRDI